MTHVLEIFCDIDTFSMSSSNHLLGHIGIKYGTCLFPAPKWEDFVIPILSSWLMTTLNIMEGNTEHRTFFFMDGPFEAKVQLPVNENWQIECIDGHTDKVVCDFPVKPRDFLQAVTAAADRVLHFCQVNLLQPNSIDSLIVAITQSKLRLQGRI